MRLWYIVSVMQRIMYIENKSGGLTGQAIIGRVTFSKTKRSVHYKGKTFLKAQGYKYNHIEVQSGDEYWISGCHKDGKDRLYNERLPIHIDEDVREEYWVQIRSMPEMKHVNKIN